MPPAPSANPRPSRLRLVILCCAGRRGGRERRVQKVGSAAGSALAAARARDARQPATGAGPARGSGTHRRRRRGRRGRRRRRAALRRGDRHRQVAQGLPLRPAIVSLHAQPRPRARRPRPGGAAGRRAGRHDAPLLLQRWGRETHAAFEKWMGRWQLVASQRSIGACDAQFSFGRHWLYVCKLRIGQCAWLPRPARAAGLGSQRSLGSHSGLALRFHPCFTLQL